MVRVGAGLDRTSEGSLQKPLLCVCEWEHSFLRLSVCLPANHVPHAACIIASFLTCSYVCLGFFFCCFLLNMVILSRSFCLPAQSHYFKEKKHVFAHLFLKMSAPEKERQTQVVAAVLQSIGIIDLICFQFDLILLV